MMFGNVQQQPTTEGILCLTRVFCYSFAVIGTATFVFPRPRLQPGAADRGEDMCKGLEAYRNGPCQSGLGARCQRPPRRLQEQEAWLQT